MARPAQPDHDGRGARRQAGGSYQYTSHSERGEFVFFGEFREVEEPGLLVATFQWKDSGYPPSVDRSEFRDLGDGRTQLVTTATFESKELRDGMLQSGMEGGVSDGHEKLDGILARKRDSS